MASVITLGSLFAPLITSQADRRGPRKLLLTTIAIFSLFSGLTAFAWNASSFVVLKFLTITFSVRRRIDRDGDAGRGSQR